MSILIFILNIWTLSKNLVYHPIKKFEQIKKLDNSLINRYNNEYYAEVPFGNPP